MCHSDTFVSILIPGITNYEEYSLIQETVEEKKEDGMGTLKKDRTLLRDERKMEKLKAKLHTDDDCEYSGTTFVRMSTVGHSFTIKVTVCVSNSLHILSFVL